MNYSDWITFLGNQNLLLEEQGEPCIGRNTKETNNNAPSTIVPLVHQEILSVEGKDSEKFLQGQLSCDIATVSEQKSCLGTACSPQGRVYSSFRVMRIPKNGADGFLLRMRASITEQTLATLNKYIVFFKSEIGNADDRYIGIGLFGKNSESLLSNLFGQVPENDNDMIFSEETIIVRIPGSCPRFECWSTPERAQTNWNKLSENSVVGSSDDWFLEDIKAGLGEISSATTDLFIPQMLNFQAVGAISFDKGCYTGQEIVARTQYRGKSKRFMVRLLITGAPLLKAGAHLNNPQDKNIATVVSASPAGKNVQQVLAVILENAAENLREVSLQGACFSIEQQSLPYTLQV